MISLRSVSKVFRLYPDLVRSRLKQGIFFWKRYYTEKVALSDITLDIGPGETVGVIGPNGAGKTTLLKIIAGISRATSGTVEVRGKVVTVLALGLGFHPRLTGLENIDLAGLMLGMSLQEIERHKDWIIDFAELGPYIHQPLNAYSSGMRARLSFAIAACRTPPILIIDEALATGDIRFVQKCINRIQEITRSGTTALFVSHNIWSIKRLTSRCILIDGGRIVEDGQTGPVTDRYYEVMLRYESDGKRPENRDLSSYVGTGQIILKSIEMRSSSGTECTETRSGENATFVLDLEAESDLDNVAMCLSFGREDGVLATAVGAFAGGGLNDKCDFESPIFRVRKGRMRVLLKCEPLLLAPGDYSMDVSIFDVNDYSGFTSTEQYYFKARAFEFSVRRLGNPNRSMVYYQPAKIHLEQVVHVGA